ncbi:MAG: SDR family NAD(P)-dependent oxidoreductase [Candidatus Hodarchaeales archaeon]|jgi:serine 3-dehydrogenase
MVELANKTVLITGATSGIGKSCAYLFAKSGANLIITARRYQRLKEIANNIVSKYKVNCNYFKIDVRDKEEVNTVIKQISEKHENIDFLINNAGLAKGLETVQEATLEYWEEMIDTNIKGLLYMTRGILPIMLKQDFGHIINIGSIAGHEVYPKGSVYCATKFAVNALTQGIRIDVIGSPIRVSTIDPGAVETEFSTVRFNGDEDRAEKVYQGMTPLTPDDVAEAVVWVSNRPKHVSIHEVIIMPSDQATTTRVNRRS